MIENHSKCIRVSDTKICPFCYDPNIIKNGTTKTKKQQFFCKKCNKQFLDFYTYQAYKPWLNDKIIQFTKEGLGIRSAARILKISTTTLLKKIIQIAQTIQKPIISMGKSYEVDEIRFYIKKKANPLWLVYALDKNSKKVVCFSIGRRNNKTINEVIRTLLNSKAEKIFTDKLINYLSLIPKETHSIKRFSTNHIERKNLTIRTHLKRMGRKTICFSRNYPFVTLSFKFIFGLKINWSFFKFSSQISITSVHKQNSLNDNKS